MQNTGVVGLEVVFRSIRSRAPFGGAKVKPMGGGFIRWRSSTISWIARQLKFIPLSSAEAEVAAIVMMLKEALFILMLLQDLKVAPPDAILVQGFTDSKSGRDIVIHPGLPGVTKHTAHFARWLHFAREHVLNGALQLHLVPDVLMMADDKTKAVELRKRIVCRDYQDTRDTHSTIPCTVSWASFTYFR